MPQAEILTDGSIAPSDFRSAMGHFATGVTVVTTQVGGTTHGMTANAFLSVSLNPPLVLVSVDNRARMNQYLDISQRYGVSILAAHHDKLSTHFAGRPQDEIELSFVHENEIPLIKDAVAHMVARVVQVHAAGDHKLYIGQVEYLDWHEGHPLLFYGGKYRQLDPERLPPARWPEDEFALFTIGPM